MKTEESTDIIKDKWWHRLLRVLMYCSTGMVLFIAGFFLIDEYDYGYKYVYSFEPDYELVKGWETICSPGYGDMIECGGLSTINALLGHYEDVRISGNKISEPVPRVDEKSKRRYTTAELDEMQSSIERNVNVLRDLGNHKIRSRRTIVWNAEPIALSIAKTIGIAALWYVFALMSYKTVLFIAYGRR